MQIKSNHLWSLVCPTHDQCKIHEVYASGNKILLGHKCDVLKTYYNILKVQKNATKHWDRHKYTEYKLKLKIEFTKVLNESSNNNKQKQLSKSIMLCVSFSIWAHKNSPFHYAHFLSCDALPLTICYRPIYTICTWSPLSPFLAWIAKGFPLTCIESHLAMFQWR